MNEQQAERWEEIRVKGRVNYIINTGIIRWGLGTAILFTIIFTYLQKGGAGITFSNNDFVITLLIALIVFSIGGYFWGQWLWNKNMNKYVKK